MIQPRIGQRVTVTAGSGLESGKCRLPLSLIVRVNRRTILRNLRWAVARGENPADFRQRRRERFRRISERNIDCDISTEEAMRRIFT